MGEEFSKVKSKQSQCYYRIIYKMINHYILLLWIINEAGVISVG